METDLTHGTGNSRISPCFEDEWTILTARPVVPLDELKTKTTRHTLLKLVAAFVLALALGAGTALMTVGLRSITDQTVESAVVPEQGSVAEAEPTPLELPADVTTTLEESEVEPERVLPKKIPVTVTLKPKTSSVASKQQTTAVNSVSLTKDTNPEVEVEDSQLSVNRFEERRLRRVFRRQRRERAAQGSRNLLRIDEIFEGRRP